MKINNPPAFPSVYTDTDCAGKLQTTINQGMTLRDWFAGQASHRVVEYFVTQYIEVQKTNNPDEWKEPLVYSEHHMKKVAMIEARYRAAYADAQLTEREKERE